MFVRTLSEMARAVSAGQADRYALLYAPDAVITIHGGEAQAIGQWPPAAAT